MRRMLYAMPGLLVLGGMLWWDYITFAKTSIAYIDPVTVILVGAASLVLLYLGVTFVVVACKANVYRVLHGEVIETRSYMYSGTGPSSWLFVASNQGAAFFWMPGRPYYGFTGHSIKVRRDDGRIAWIRVNEYFFEKVHRGDYVDLRLERAVHVPNYDRRSLRR